MSLAAVDYWNRATFLHEVQALPGQRHLLVGEECIQAHVVTKGIR